jgi:transposase
VPPGRGLRIPPDEGRSLQHEPARTRDSGGEFPLRGVGLSNLPLKNAGLPELHGWQVEIADAQKVKGLAPLACKTDRIDAWVFAELARRDLVPAIWLPDPLVRAERERARWRLHLVRHPSSLKQRVHAVVLTHGRPCPVSDLFGVRGRRLLARLGLPEPWQATIEATLRLIDELGPFV